MASDDIVSTIIKGLTPKLLKDAHFIKELDSLSLARVREVVNENGIKSVVVQLGSDGKKRDVGQQHDKFPQLLNVMANKLPVYIVGPAGSGKTMGVEQAAKALGITFACMSVGPMTTQSHIFGYMDAVGKYVGTEFRKQYEHGGVFLFDEIDAGNPQVLTSINSALSSDQCAFPDGMVKKHEGFICAASGNTWGLGGSVEYVGRNAMDAATLDRFVFLEWPYDLKFEMLLASNKTWVERIQGLRALAIEKDLRVVISPRASINGSKLLDAGFTEEEVLKMLVYKGMDEAMIKKLNEK